MTPSFEPTNDLEHALVAVQQGQLTIPALLPKLLAARVVVMIDKEPDLDGRWAEGTKPLTLLNSSGTPVLAMFSAVERVGQWPRRQPQFSYGVQTDFAWLLQGVAPNVGIVINPELPVGLEIEPATVVQLQGLVKASGNTTQRSKPAS